MYRLLALILLVLLVALQMKLWNGNEGSWPAEQDLQVQVAQQRVENAKLKERNTALAAEVEDLKTGQAAVEERARSELGMVKPGETFYRVVEPQDPNTNMLPEDVPEDAASTSTQAPVQQASRASRQSSTHAPLRPLKSTPASSPPAQPQAPVGASNQ